MRKILNIALAGLCAVTLQHANAQQNFANDLRSEKASSRITTLPLDPSTRTVYFVNIRDKDVVRSPFRVVFGVVGFGIAPAGFQKEGTGHHHLLIDTKLPLDLNQPIPFSDKYVHFGKGQTETVLNLSPGKHSLQLLFADYDHKPMFKGQNNNMIVIYSKKIDIIVEGPASKK